LAISKNPKTQLLDFCPLSKASSAFQITIPDKKVENLEEVNWNELSWELEGLKVRSSCFSISCYLWVPFTVSSEQN